ncbi:MAG: hypothetical protein MK116_07125 [Phycisphaerales bacterium]|nr:hypothetical protein [Phycisphaerales bacterium]
MKRLLTITVAATAAMMSTSAMADQKDEAMKHLASYIGQWESGGMTNTTWPNIPAGIKYTSKHEFQWNSMMDTILVDWRMTSAGGKTLSMGTGMMTWSDLHDTLVYEYTGQDMGISFHGSCKMTSYTDKGMTWRGTESAEKGEAIWYESTDTFPSASGNSWTASFQPCDSKWNATGKPDKTEMARVNTFPESCGPMKELVGTWSWTTTDDAGNPTTRTETYEWGPGNRSIMGRFYETQDGQTMMTACETIYANNNGKGIRGHYWDNKGLNVNWSMMDMEDKGSESWWTINYWGRAADGTSINGTGTGKLMGTNRRTFDFDTMYYGGTEMSAADMNPEGRVFKRTSTMANVPTN